MLFDVESNFVEGIFDSPPKVAAFFNRVVVHNNPCFLYFDPSKLGIQAIKNSFKVANNRASVYRRSGSLIPKLS